MNKKLIGLALLLSLVSNSPLQSMEYGPVSLQSIRKRAAAWLDLANSDATFWDQKDLTANQKTTQKNRINNAFSRELQKFSLTKRGPVMVNFEKLEFSKLPLLRQVQTDLQSAQFALLVKEPTDKKMEKLGNLNDPNYLSPLDVLRNYGSGLDIKHNVRGATAKFIDNLSEALSAMYREEPADTRDIKAMDQNIRYKVLALIDHLAKPNDGGVLIDQGFISTGYLKNIVTEAITDINTLVESFAKSKNKDLSTGFAQGGRDRANASRHMADLEKYLNALEFAPGYLAVTKALEAAREAAEALKKAQSHHGAVHKE